MMSTPIAPDAARTWRDGFSATLLVLALLAVVLGDVMAFNQLATQSATDAIIPLLVVSIGTAMAIDGLRRIVCRRRRADLVVAAGEAVLSALAWIAWAANWPLAGSAWIAIGAGALVAVGTNLFPSLPESTPNDTTGSAEEVRPGPDLGSVVAVLGLLQAIVLVWFAVLALIDAPTGPFG